MLIKAYAESEDVEDDEHSGRSSISRADANMKKITETTMND